MPSPKTRGRILHRLPPIEKQVTLVEQPKAPRISRGGYWNEAMQLARSTAGWIGVGYHWRARVLRSAALR